MCSIAYNILNGIALMCSLLITIVGYFAASICLKKEQIELIGVENSNSLKICSFMIGCFGLFIIGLAVMGFISVNLEWTILMLVYLILTGLLAVGLALLGRFALYVVSNVSVVISDVLKGKVAEHKANLTTSEARGPKTFPPLDQIQLTFKCCDISDMNVYKFSDERPDSCCSPDELLKHANTCKAEWDYGRFCDEAIVKTVSSVLWWLGIGLISLAVLHGVLITLVLILHSKISDTESTITLESSSSDDSTI